MDSNTPTSEPPAPLIADEEGATSLEWALLLAAIALPSYYIIRMLLNIVAELYRMNTSLNAVPFP
ncbi:MAG: hypothetical protein K8S99_18600 [Planctomycetes bacterium]|nr:hypothetical protein [Planctomycetota bacterium]